MYPSLRDGSQMCDTSRIAGLPYQGDDPDPPPKPVHFESLCVTVPPIRGMVTHNIDFYLVCPAG